MLVGVILLAVAGTFARRLWDPDTASKVKYVVLATGPTLLSLVLCTFGVRGSLLQLPRLPTGQPERVLAPRGSLSWEQRWARSCCC
jgi:hypothetical protein